MQMTIMLSKRTIKTLDECRVDLRTATACQFPSDAVFVAENHLLRGPDYPPILAFFMKYGVIKIRMYVIPALRKRKLLPSHVQLRPISLPDDDHVMTELIRRVEGDIA